MRKINFLILFFIAALLVRLACLYPQYSGDVKNHLVWAQGFLLNPVGLYSRHFSGFNDINYPSITLYLFAVSRFIYVAVVSLISWLNSYVPVFPSFLVPLFESENMALGFMKLPAIIADIGIGILLLSFFNKSKYKNPLFLTSLFLFNPAVIYISSVWGQIESVTIFFLLLSLYLGCFHHGWKGFLSIFFFAVAVLTKQTALWFTPFYLLLWYQEFKRRDWFEGVISAVTVFIFSYLPFGLDPLAAVRSYLSTLSGSSDYVSDAAYNLWWFFYPTPTSDAVMIGPVSVRVLSVAMLIFSLVILIRLNLKKYSKGTFFNTLFIWSLLVFFLQTRVHERHLAPALVFGLLTPALFSRYYIDYLVLSAYHMYNLITVLKLPFI